MAVNLVVAVTDDGLFELLRRVPDLGEVNFWAPSATTFAALQPGELGALPRARPTQRFRATSLAISR